MTNTETVITFIVILVCFFLIKAFLKNSEIIREKEIKEQKKLELIIAEEKKILPKIIAVLEKTNSIDLNFYKNSIFSCKTNCYPQCFKEDKKEIQIITDRIILTEKYTILGISYFGSSDIITLPLGGYLRYHYGNTYPSINEQTESLTIGRGEVKTIFYLFDYVPPEKFLRISFCGLSPFSSTKDIDIKFSLNKKAV